MRKSVNEKQRKCGQVYCQAPGAEPSLGLGQVEGSPEDETLRSPLWVAAPSAWPVFPPSPPANSHTLAGNLPPIRQATCLPKSLL